MEPIAVVTSLRFSRRKVAMPQNFGVGWNVIEKTLYASLESWAGGRYFNIFLEGCH
jgi:hypothetical protein